MAVCDLHGYLLLFLFIFCGTVNPNQTGVEDNVIKPAKGGINNIYENSSMSTPPLFTADDGLQSSNTSSPWPTSCRIRSVDDYMYERVQNKLDTKVKLIEYILEFQNYAENPLLVNVSWSYKANLWARVSSKHGQTLLSLAFNYGVLSLMTLTMGTESLPVELRDEPFGCFGELGETDKIDTITHLLIRDFKHEEDVMLEGEERVCHEIIKGDNGHAVFKDYCCHRHELTKEITCSTAAMNIWLTILHLILALVRFTVLFFGPILFIPVVETISNQNFPYAVKLKDPLYKNICIANSETHIPTNYKVKHTLDFRRSRGLQKLRIASSDMTLGLPAKVRVSEYNILVDYRKLLPENDVPVGLWNVLSKAIFYCKLREVGPFKKCCKANMLSMFSNRTPIPWIALWKKVGRLLLILFLPMPFYLRLVVYYVFEIEELDGRKNAANNIGLTIKYDKSLLHFLSPTHPLFISMYCLYFVTAILLAYMSRTNESGKFRRMLVGSFTDLKNMSWVNILRVSVGNLIWPFQRFGAIGCLVSVLFWPLAIPFSIIMFVFFCLPAVYMTARMIFYSQQALRNKIVKKRKGRSAYRIQKNQDNTTDYFDISHMHNKCTGRKPGDDDLESRSTISLGTITSQRSRLSSTSTAISIMSEKLKTSTAKCWQITLHIVAATLLIITMYSILFLLSECIGSVVEIVTFTLMGIIINAGAVLKYVMLLFLVLLYSYDTFNNVPKKYLKLNKAIFNEVKGRCKDLEKVTSLPSSLQVNFGFKSQELGEQADYETPDDIYRKVAHHWLINDLTLFVDNDDFPRIPKKLFEDVCQIRVAGAPGPVWRALINAFKDFLKIVVFLFFVFLIVLSFGFVYKVSSTNQMMATAAGGFLPFILKSFMAPVRPDIEIGTVSFKSKMDEIIKNFYQIWPIYDFPFEKLTEDEIKELENPDGENGDDKGSKKGDENEDNNDKKTENAENPGSTSEPVIKLSTHPPSYADAKELIPKDKRDENQNKEVNGDQIKPATPTQAKQTTELFRQIKALPENTVSFTNIKKPKFMRQKSSHSNAIEMSQFTELTTEEETVEVDILIFLPERINEDWLDVWSDLDEYDAPPDIDDVEIDETTALNVDLIKENNIVNIV